MTGACSPLASPHPRRRPAGGDLPGHVPAPYQPCTALGSLSRRDSGLLRERASACARKQASEGARGPGAGGRACMRLATPAPVDRAEKGDPSEMNRRSLGDESRAAGERFWLLGRCRRGPKPNPPFFPFPPANRPSAPSSRAGRAAGAAPLCTSTGARAPRRQRDLREPKVSDLEL